MIGDILEEQQIIAALNVVVSNFGKEQAKVVEQIFRNETDHFKSGNFQHTLSPGMEAFSTTTPYGWKSCIGYWKTNPEYAPVEIFKQVENASAMSGSRGERSFLKFDTLEASMMTVAYIIHSRGGDGGSWFSVTDAGVRLKYNDYLKKIIPRFTNKL